VSLTEKFNLPHARGDLMFPEDVVYVLSWADVEGVASEHGLEIDLTEDEMQVFRKCLESGMSCWSEVIGLALACATSERPRGAVRRLEQFVQTGNPDVLLEGLDDRPLRLQITDSLGNVSYLRKVKGSWSLSGANGTPYSLSNIATDSDGQRLRFALDDAGDDEVKVIRALNDHARQHQVKEVKRV
jgi:hypothetical protein